MTRRSMVDTRDRRDIGIDVVETRSTSQGMVVVVEDDGEKGRTNSFAAVAAAAASKSVRTVADRILVFPPRSSSRGGGVC